MVVSAINLTNALDRKWNFLLYQGPEVLNKIKYTRKNDHELKITQRIQDVFIEQKITLAEIENYISYNFGVRDKHAYPIYSGKLHIGRSCLKFPLSCQAYICLPAQNHLLNLQSYRMQYLQCPFPILLSNCIISGVSAI